MMYTSKHTSPFMFSLSSISNGLPGSGMQPASHRKSFSEDTIQVECDNMDLPPAKIRFELLKLGAINLDTILLLSSIPDKCVIGFKI